MVLEVEEVNPAKSCEVIDKQNKMLGSPDRGGLKRPTGILVDEGR